jgi:V8-like Glu-specific endopeptidase
MRRAGRRPGLAAASVERRAADAADSAAGGAADGVADGTTDIAAGPDGPAAAPAGRRIVGWVRRPALRLGGILSVGALGGYLLNPAAQAAGLPVKHSKPFNGTPAVGALFTVVNGKLASHFCTASVVHSRAGNLLITAAHCVFRNAQPLPGSMAFVPGYHRGKTPRGVWGITAVYVNKAWQLRRNVNNDVAFLIAGRPGTHIERHTGAEVLGIDRPPQVVQVIGYPDSTKRPVSCVAPARTFRTDSHQMVFDCDDFTTGTSGGPFLARVNAKTGDGTVIGVIGGWQEGGDSPSESYSPRFFTNVRDLYDYATSGQPPPS